MSHCLSFEFSVTFSYLKGSNLHASEKDVVYPQELSYQFVKTVENTYTDKSGLTFF